MEKLLDKKLQSERIAIMTKKYIKQNFPNDFNMLKRFDRQFRCAYKINKLVGNKHIKIYRCGLISCPICQSKKAADFIKKYGKEIDQANFKYHMTLTIKSPREENLGERINMMFKFWSNSGLKKNKLYKKLNLEIKYFRVLECNFNSNSGTYKLHFHLILAGNQLKQIEIYCKIIVSYWQRYFKFAASEDAQYFEILRENSAKNISYVFKFTNVSVSNIEMYYHFLKSIKRHKIFYTKNFSRTVNKTTNINCEDDQEFLFSKNILNWINESSGELLIS